MPANVQFGAAKASSLKASPQLGERSGVIPPAAAAAQQRATAAILVQAGRPALKSGRTPQIPEVETPKKPRASPPQFIPRQPRTWDELGLDPQSCMQMVLRMMMGKSGASGKRMAKDAGLAWPLVRDIMNHLKDKKLVTYRSTTALGDFVSELTDAGYKKAIDSREVTQYEGIAPVAWEHYLKSVSAQALTLFNPGAAELKEAFSDLAISEDLLERLGPAVTSCKPLFLFGEPGNGKTSLAERMTTCFSDTIWIPHTLSISGHLVKLFDPAIHVVMPNDPQVLADSRVDPRWIQIKRPTVIAGGELELGQLDVQYNDDTHVHEAPLQLKANCGTLVIDDFGRGKTTPKDLLNRWIFPLEKQIDFMRLPDGRKFACPFECLLVFSTNLEPKDLADEAFLRRIPYKVHVGDPDEFEYTDLMKLLANKMGVDVSERSIKYLIDRHYKMAKRPMRFCHPRDLLLQVIHLCEYRGVPKSAGPPEWDRVVSNYFGLA
ncbi:MAG: AAA family ATPase [Rhodobacterales bacterium]|nr:AAA family ATPase [Rhodobacterales bacterium]